MKTVRIFRIIVAIALGSCCGLSSPAGTGEAYRLLMEGKYESAITIYENHLEEYPDDRIALFNLGTAFYRTSRFSSAAECFEKSIPLAIEDPGYQSIAHYNLGCSLFQSAYAQSRVSLNESLELLRSARVHFENALELDSESIKTRKNLERVKALIEQFNSFAAPPKESASTGIRQENGDKNGSSANPEESKTSEHSEQTPDPAKDEQSGSNSEGDPSDMMNPSNNENPQSPTTHPEMTKEEAQLFLRALEKNEKRLSISRLHHRGSELDSDDSDTEPTW